MDGQTGTDRFGNTFPIWTDGRADRHKADVRTNDALSISINERTNTMTEPARTTLKDEIAGVDWARMGCTYDEDTIGSRCQDSKIGIRGVFSGRLRAGA
jgi:hypothetical protein